MFSLATLHMPSEPSTDVTSNPIWWNARESLPDPQPRSRTNAPSGRNAVNLFLRSDTSAVKVLAE